jgi:hypothetical protein
MKTKEITIEATEHPNVHEAIQHLSVSADDRAISVAGKYLTVKTEEVDRLELAGVQFGLLSDRNGRIMTVPVN